MPGLRTIIDLHDRSRVDEATGCWVVDAVRLKGTSYVWMADYRRTMSLTMAMAYLIDGKKPPKGKMYVAMCGDSSCGNPAHRQLGTRALLMKVARPALDPLHRAKIARAHQARVKVKLTPEVLAAARESDLPAYKVADQLGVHPSTLGKALNGGSWRAGAAANSVFSIGSR